MSGAEIFSYQFNVGAEGTLCGVRDMRVHLCVVFVWLLTPADKFQQSERGPLLRARDRRTAQIVQGGKKTPLGTGMKWVLVVRYLITNGLWLFVILKCFIRNIALEIQNDVCENNSI